MKQDVQPDGELRYCMKPFWFPGTNFLTMNIWEISKSLQIPKYFCWWHWKVANLMLEDWLSTGSKFWSNRNTWTKWGDYKQLLLLNIQRDEFCVWKLCLTTKSRTKHGLCDLRPPLMFHSTERSDLSKWAGKKNNILNSEIVWTLFNLPIKLPRCICIAWQVLAWGFRQASWQRHAVNE